MADSGDSDYLLHGCRCLEGDEPNRPHFHCPCVVCNGRAVSLMTGWRHREKNRTLNAGQKNLDVQKAVYEIASQVDRECYYEEVTTASLLAPYSQLAANKRGNLADAEPLLLGDDSVLANEDDDVLLEEDFIDGQSDEMESCCLEENCREVHDDEENVQEFIYEAVLKLVELKGENGFSVKAFEEILRWGKGLHCHTNPDLRQKWPTTWEDVKSFLESIGYRDAKLYWICLDESHPCNYGVMESKEEQCKHCGNVGNIPFYYLSLVDKITSWWCSSPMMCKKITAHWEQRDHWLPEECKHGWGFPEKKEIWDGKRFSELSYFWDPSKEWTLQCFAPCKIVIK